MLKNRDITVRIGKKATDDDVSEEPRSEVPIEDKIQRVVQVLKGPAKYGFLAIGAYVFLDTFRQVAVAKANYPNE